MILEEKTYTSKEIAEWFGISYKTLRNQRTKRIAELSDYAEYTVGHNSITITKILDPERVEYDGTTNFVKKYVADHFEETWDFKGIETCTRVAAKLYVAYCKEYPTRKQPKESTFLYCVQNEKNSRGLNLRREWCKMYGAVGANANVKTRSKNVYESLTLEQKKEFVDEFFKHYKRDNVAHAILELNEKYKQGELKDIESFKNAYEEFNSTIGMNDMPYTSFLSEMADKFSCDWMVRGSKAEK